MSFEAAGLGFRYDGAAAPVLEGLSFSLPPDRRLAVFGPSGVGKSTLLYLLGLLWGDGADGGRRTGTIRYVDRHGATHDYARLPLAQEEQLRRVEFGFALQSSYLLPNFTCEENVAMPLLLQGKSESAARATARQLLAQADEEADGDSDGPGRVRLVDRASATHAEISGGQQQRVAVLRAIAHDPQVVFADEPFSALDATNKDRILGLLGRWHAGALGAGDSGGARGASNVKRTLVLVCHDAEVARKHADLVLHLRPGHRHELVPAAEFRPDTAGPRGADQQEPQGA